MSNISQLAPPAKRARGGSMAEDTELLTFAVPKKGRLYEHVVDLLKGCGLKYTRNPRLDIAYVHGEILSLKLVFLPAADIARFVADGNVDVGITGQDIVQESGANVKEIFSTGFGICQLVVLAPKKNNITDVKTLAGKRIATSFPNLTERYFADLLKGTGLPMPTILTLSGSIEVACTLGVADACVDLMESGLTAQEAGLEKIGLVLDTQAVLISNPHSTHNASIEAIRKRIEGYIVAKKYQMMKYNISKAGLPTAIKITPGRKAPTILTLEDPKFNSVEVMVESKTVADVMDRLQEAGATDIVVMGIDNCRT